MPALSRALRVASSSLSQFDRWVEPRAKVNGEKRFHELLRMANRGSSDKRMSGAEIDIR